jgi:beta-lactamase superfamily II metal-dependent hydrolase
MDVFTLYAGQGSLAAVRAGNEAVIVDAHMPNCDDICQDQIEQGLASYLSQSTVRGLILTGLDRDHACPSGVDSILTAYKPDWVMYPTYYKDTDVASEVFGIIAREVEQRQHTPRPLTRHSVRVDRVDSRHLLGLARFFTFELFSPHMDDMDCSNNSSIVLKLTGTDQSGFSYLITGDTETERWECINRYFGKYLASPVLAASHHGSRTGVNAKSLLLISPHTVLISAGIDNAYGHPDGVAVQAYQRVATRVFCTNADSGEGVCFLTRSTNGTFDTHPVRHFSRRTVGA